MQGLMPGSVSKYCLQQSPIPVIVVRPSTKRAQKKMKRARDSSATRTLYGSMLHQAQSVGGSHALEKGCDNAVMGLLPDATEQEAAAVAQAIGLPKNYKGTYGGPLARVTSIKSEVDSGADSTNPTEGFLPAGIFRAIVPDRADLVLKSPAMVALADVWNDDSEDEKKEDEKQERGGKDQSPEMKSQLLGVARTVEDRRPSVRETNPWLDQILRKEDKPRGLSPGVRGHGRSLSR
jgi:hypothetical protein